MGRRCGPHQPSQRAQCHCIMMTASPRRRRRQISWNCECGHGVPRSFPLGSTFPSIARGTREKGVKPQPGSLCACRAPSVALPPRPATVKCTEYGRSTAQHSTALEQVRCIRPERMRTTSGGAPLTHARTFLESLHLDADEPARLTQPSTEHRAQSTEHRAQSTDRRHVAYIIGPQAHPSSMDHIGWAGGRRR